MIPILYESTEKNFTTNGLGRLKDAISCYVIEERNGSYELEMDYPVNGIHYSDLKVDRIIYAMPSDGKDPQPFRIYKISRPLSGQVSVSAEHISYLLSTAVVMPFTASSCVEAINYLNTGIVGVSDFTFWTDKSVTGTYKLEKPTEARSVLGGTSGSILDTYGTGEYEFDGFTVKLHLHRGEDKGVTIRYGKNLSDLTAEQDTTNVYTGIVPYASNQDDDGNEISVVLPEKVIKSEHTGDYAYPLYKVVDFSSENQGEDTLSVDELRTLAENYVKNNEGWEAADSLTVSFVALWQTDEYKNIAPLERVNLCDTVHVIYTDLGVNVKAKVTKTDFDVLNERYNSIELGEASNNLSKTLNEAINESSSSLADTVSALPAAINRATKKITGGLGGFVVLKPNANGQPEELLIMDTNDITTATKVWRWNQEGLAYSSTGYNGEYGLAMTSDGEIVADFITTGLLNANIIRAGVIADTSGNTSWNLESGALTSNKLSINSANFMLTEDGAITSTAGTIGGFTIGKDFLAFGKTGLENNTGDGIFISKEGIAIGENGHGVPYLRGISSSSSLSSGFDKVTVQLLTIGGSSGQSHGSIDSWDGSDGGWSSGYSYGIQSTCKFHVGKSLDEKGHLYVDGNIYYKGELKPDSDQRLKKNIKSLGTKAIDFVLGLRPVSFEFIEAPDKIRHGFIAQEVQEIQYDGWTPAEVGWEGMDGGNYLTLSYLELISDMVATIQYQNKRMDELEKRLASLEERYADN